MALHFILIALTAVVCVWAMAWVWIRNKEAMHPLLVVVPLLIGGYVWTPFQGIGEDSFVRLFRSDQLSMVLTVNLLFIAAFLAGSLWQTTKTPGAVALASFQGTLAFLKAVRPKVTRLAILLGLYANAGYWYGVMNVGGFTAAFGQSKGGGFNESGYLGESFLAGYPAAIAYAASRSGTGRVLGNMVVCVLMTLPGLMQGTFGGRRGPLFLTMMALFLCWFLLHGKRPSVKGLAVAVVLCSFAVLFWGAQRQYVYLGSDEGIEVSRLLESIKEERGGEGGTFASGAAIILTSAEREKYHWGRRYLVTYVMRPIPKQVFPGKLDLYDWGNVGGPNSDDMLLTLGWRPRTGYATGFVADLFVEFSWLGLLGAFLYGALVGYVWRQAGLRGGLWLLELGLLMILSIYIPTQSVSAFMQRFLLMSGFCWLGWRWILQRDWQQWQFQERGRQTGGHPPALELTPSRQRPRGWQVPQSVSHDPVLRRDRGSLAVRSRKI